MNERLPPLKKIAPIQTFYKGYLFRSRLEARWAVFYDSLGLKWEYEKEKYALGHGLLYTPDFYFPNQSGLDGSFWIEIKGKEPTREEIEKAVLLCEGLKEPVYVFYGPIHLPLTYSPECPPAYNPWDWPYFWCECTECGLIGIEFDGRSDRLSCKKNSFDEKPSYYRPNPKPGCHTSAHGDKGYNYDSPRLLFAYTAALSARF